MPLPWTQQVLDAWVANSACLFKANGFTPTVKRLADGSKCGVDLVSSYLLVSIILWVEGHADLDFIDTSTGKASARYASFATMTELVAVLDGYLKIILDQRRV